MPAGSARLPWAGARSHLDDGRLVLWQPRTRLAVAVDAERRRTPPTHLARRVPGDFWAWWTRLEVLCKLLDVPVLAAVRDGLPPGGCAVRVTEVDGVVICFGARCP